MLPVGLLTLDEIGIAGSLSDGDGHNHDVFLRTNQWFWSMTPCTFATYASVHGMSSDGYYFGNVGQAQFSNGVRPVISLNSDTIFSSVDGSLTNPFIVLP